MAGKLIYLPSETIKKLNPLALFNAGGVITLLFQKQLQGNRRHLRISEEEVCQEVENGGGEGQTEAGVQHGFRLVYIYNINIHRLLYL